MINGSKKLMIAVAMYPFWAFGLAALAAIVGGDEGFRVTASFFFHPFVVVGETLGGKQEGGLLAPFFALLYALFGAAVTATLLQYRR